MRRTLTVLTLGTLTIALTATGCGRNTGSGGSGDNSTVSQQQGGIATDPKDSMGPAVAPAGATEGGIVSVLDQNDLEHMDPAQIYVTDGQVWGAEILRALTGFKENGDGKLLLVGDLATGPGKDTSNGKCTQWQYTLKDGLKYEDGSPILARDVAYGVARSFSPDLPNGPHYIQSWLADNPDYNGKYKGPYNGGSDLPPGVTVTGDKTITFTFKHPHCDLPFAAAQTTTTPVPKAQDTKTQYDIRPFASGPYKIKEHVRNTSFELERNPYWDPKTDPLRTRFPDGFKMIFGHENSDAANIMLADNGDAATAVSWQRVPPDVLPKVQQNPAAQKRVVQGYTQFVWYIGINNQRVKDLKVRQALNYAFDKKGFLQVQGGDTVGAPASTLESPTTIGYQKYNAYDGGPNGDPAKAKKLLGNKHPELVYAYRNTNLQQQMAVAVQQALQKAGFKVVLKPIDASQAYTTFGRKDNQYDLYLVGWGSDWPTGATIIPPLFDGRTITPKGNQDYSYFNSSDVNKKIDEISKLPAQQAAPKWAELDKEIMTKYAPLIPAYYDKYYRMTGSRIGGTYLSAAYGLASLTKVYVKK